MAIGYNVNNINTLMEEVNKACTSFASGVKEKFSSFQSVLNKEWVGADQQDFEEELIKRLNKLFDAVESLSKNANDNIYNLGHAWIEFQNKNTISGNASKASRVLFSSLEKPEKLKLEQIVYKRVELNSSQNLGLASESSKTTMATKLSDFVTEVKTSANTLYSQIETKNAFFGSNQQSSVKSYIEKVGQTIGDIESSIKDFDTAMAQLSDAYVTADSDVSTEMGKLNTELESGSKNIETRWG